MASIASNTGTPDGLFDDDLQADVVARHGIRVEELSDALDRVDDALESGADVLYDHYVDNDLTEDIHGNPVYEDDTLVVLSVHDAEWDIAFEKTEVADKRIQAAVREAHAQLARDHDADHDADDLSYMVIPAPEGG